MKTNIQFMSSGQTVQGKFYSAQGDSAARPTVLMLSGFPGNENDVLDLGDELSRRGLNTLTFNYRGTHRSEGDYSLQNTQKDIQAALEFLQDTTVVEQYRIDTNNLVLGGWSYGGGMGLIYAANHPQIRSVFSVAGTDHGQFARDYLSNDAFSTMLDDIFEDLKAPHGPVRFSGKIAIRNELIKNPDPYDLLLHAQKLADRNILLIGGWDDENVHIEHHMLPFYRTLTNLGAKKVKIKALQDNHAFEQSRPEIADSILSWIESLSE